MATKKRGSKPETVDELDREAYLRQQLQEVHALIGECDQGMLPAHVGPQYRLRAQKLRDALDNHLEAKAAAAEQAAVGPDLSADELVEQLSAALIGLPADLLRRVLERVEPGRLRVVQ